MFHSIEDRLLARPPAASCCGFCCCRRRVGLRRAVLWTAALLILEAVWHVAISVLRPLWEWNSTLITVLAFVLQDLARLVVSVAAVRAIRVVRAHTQPGTSASARAGLVRARITFLFRVLVCLIILELCELTVKHHEVHMVCTAPYVKEVRMKRNPNMTKSELAAAEARCELISDLYDYVMEVLTILLLCYLSWIVHSYGRSVTASASADQQENDADADNNNTGIYASRGALEASAAPHEIVVQGTVVSVE